MNPNIDILYFINNGMANPLFDAVLPTVTNFGGFGTMLALCIIALIVTRYYKKDKFFRIAKMCLYALILSGIIALGLKLLYHSPRPYVVLEHVRQLAVPTEPNSFPSGHTSATLSVVTVLVSELRENKVLVVLLILFAFIIGFSRIYIGMHFPLDVLVGAIVGIISAAIVLKFIK